MAGVRARSRPRRRSVNFRRLWWVLVREAALRIFAPDVESFEYQLPLRSLLCRHQNGRVVHAAGLVLALHPERAGWPPGTL